jgi:Na+/proline symporter
MNFLFLDWTITVVYLALTILLGIRAIKCVKGLSGYFVAGR